MRFLHLSRWARHLGWNDVIFTYLGMLHTRNTIAPGTGTNKHWWFDGSLYRFCPFPFVGAASLSSIFRFLFVYFVKRHAAFMRCCVYRIPPIFRDNLGDDFLQSLWAKVHGRLVTTSRPSWGDFFASTFSQNWPPNKYGFNKAYLITHLWWLHFRIFIKVYSSVVLAVGLTCRLEKNICMLQCLVAPPPTVLR